MAPRASSRRLKKELPLSVIVSPFFSQQLSAQFGAELQIILCEPRNQYFAYWNRFRKHEGVAFRWYVKEISMNLFHQETISQNRFYDWRSALSSKRH
jgi:hypothetical protein